MHGGKHGEMRQAAMRNEVETRISTLHTKLKITPDQESAWNDVAQAMRDNESSVGTLVKDRHENAKSMTAVDDLESYEKISQAHADGLKKVVASFETLYNDMSPDQKKNADMVFGNFEGHNDWHHGKAKGAAHSAPKPATAQ
jgi:iron-sulfur cluster repair protein YtfE (RIC family)